MSERRSLYNSTSESRYYYITTSRYTDRNPGTKNLYNEIYSM